jgi:FkbM family methyltransferase
MRLPFTLQTDLPDVKKLAVERWLNTPSKFRYIFGRTTIAKKILQHYSVAGIVDDFTEETEFFDQPIFRSYDLPAEAKVLSSVIGKPKTVKQVCEQHHLDHVDYFAFQKHCANRSMILRFWNESLDDLNSHAAAYAKLWKSLADEKSREVLTSVLSLRLSGDLSVMDGFIERQHEQYFEPFLDLNEDGETFLDVGGFDGATSIYFAKQCPRYDSIHVFEPDPLNILTLNRLTQSMSRIKVHSVALGPERATLGLTSDQSRSHTCESGDIRITQERLDDLDIPTGTFLKMDIEGAELGAISGASRFIRTNQPRLAIAAYHKVDDLWRIPEAVLPLMDSNIYLRHYTEGIDETIIFFVPRIRQKSCAY